MKTFIYEHTLTHEQIVIKAENRTKATIKMAERVGPSDFNTFWHLAGEQG